MKHLVKISVISALLLTITGCGTTYELAHQCIEGDCINGEGTLTWAGGDQYVGDFVNGKRTGQGTYTDVNGNQYIGEWKDGMKHGQGTFP